MSKMATDIFLKGYQWPFDPQRITNFQSSLIDVLVFSEIQKGRRVFMDFLRNPVGSKDMRPFDLNDLEPEALTYLARAGALQQTPIERLEHMNPPAVEIYTENGIDLYAEPLEIAVCAQHNNGGLAVNKWWESSIPRTFVIGEMAGSHGVKRPGGSALNAGQTGGLRAAEYIANVYPLDLPDCPVDNPEVSSQLTHLIQSLNPAQDAASISPKQTIEIIQARMTASAGHIRELNDAKTALASALDLYRTICSKSFAMKDANDLLASIRVRHMALASVAYLKAIVELIAQGGGSRGSHLVLTDNGIEIHPDIRNPATSKPLRFKPENKSLRNTILQLLYDENEPDLFICRNIDVRPAPTERKAFEPAWRDYRERTIYTH
jgi:succinate dehydrogenase/fumarate reductase flavoprotein subunit